MKDVYLFQFDNQQKADYWREQTVMKFINSVVSVNRNKSVIEFDDSTYYFWSASRISNGLPHGTLHYSADELYIILDDPERKKLPTYTSSYNEEGGQDNDETDD